MKIKIDMIFGMLCITNFKFVYHMMHQVKFRLRYYNLIKLSYFLITSG